MARPEEKAAAIALHVYFGVPLDEAVGQIIEQRQTLPDASAQDIMRAVVARRLAWTKP